MEIGQEERVLSINDSIDIVLIYIHSLLLKLHQ
jgi:hypothetical protein